MREEIWKDIVGYEGLYQVSNLGRFKGIKFSNQRILRENPPYNKYVAVAIFMNNKRRYFLLHRLVAQLFIDNPECKSQVNHKNGVKSDNRTDNLEWCTSKENINHSISSGLRMGGRGELNNRVKLTKSQVLEIRSVYKKGCVTHKTLADKFKVTNECVRKIVIGESWRHLL